METTNLLRQKLWLKAFGEVKPKAEKWMGKTINQKIEEELGDEIEKKRISGAPHPDTIVNFLNEKNTPKRRTLDLLSWYVMGDADNFKSFQDFEVHTKSESESYKTNNGQEEVTNTSVDQLTETANILSDQEFKKRIVVAGFVTGVLSGFMLLFFQGVNGYWNLELESFHSLVVFVILYHIILGLTLGYLTSRLALKIKRSNNKKEKRKAIFFTTFIIALVIIFFGQSITRDSWLIAGDSAIGPLGVPNVEMLSNILALVVGITLIAKILTESKD